MLTLLLLVGISDLTLRAPSPEDRIATAFVQALTSGQMEAMAALATKAATTTNDWQLLRVDLETYDCISIQSHRVSVESATDAKLELLITVDATALARGGRRSSIRFPRRWRLEAVMTAGEWRLQRVVVEERVIARRLALQPELTVKAVEASAADADLETLLVFLTDELEAPARSRVTEDAEVVRSVARIHGLTIAEVASLRTMGVYAMSTGQLTRSTVIAEEALAIANVNANPDAQAMASLMSGTLQWIAGRFDAALESYAAASALMEVVDDPRVPMKALYMRGSLMTSRGSYREVLVSSAALGEAAERFDWTEGRCIAAFQQTALYAQLQDAQTERLHSAEALRCSEQLGQPAMITMALTNLATSELAAGNRAAAARLMQRIIDRTPVDNVDLSALAVSHGNLGSVLAEDERFADAEAELLTALKFAHDASEKHFEADILQTLARVRLMVGRCDEALRGAEEADAIIRDFPAVVRLASAGSPDWGVRATMGSALRAVGRLPEAIESLQSSIELIESRRAVLGTDEATLSGFMRDKAQPYRELISLLVEAGRPRDALAVSERFRAGALATAVARGHIDLLPSMSEEDRKQYDAINDSITDLNRKLFASRDDPENALRRERLAQSRLEQRAFLSRLYAGSPDIRERRIEDPQVVVGDAHRLLPRADEALLTFSVHDGETFAFFVERSGTDLDVSVQRIPIRKADLESRIRLFVSQIERRDLDYRRASRKLFDLLVAPFASRIAAKRLLYVVPDGMLWRLPFQALQRPDGRHLIELVGVGYAPSLTLLRNERHDGDRATSGSLLAVADPVLEEGSGTAARAMLRHNNLAPLPDARTEVREIQKTYGSDSRVLIGAQATETAVKRLAASFRTLHLATHGIIDDNAPMYSALVLAASADDDGLLEAREMMDLDLGADLAILSACESGGGDVTPGEGIIGMSWALMVAGCRNTMVSQWKVQSRSTTALMIAFHREVNRPVRDYASALRKAQLTLMRTSEFSHPYYWSPFVLVSTSQ